MTVPKTWRRIPELYNLQGTKCKSCSALFFPGREVCVKCGSISLEPYRFQGKGRVVTFTIIRSQISDPEGENIDIPAREIPYVLAIVELAEGPMLTCQIVDTPEKDVFIGKQVDMVFRKIVEKGKRGVIQYGYKFR
ncbi:MAG: Zn-ribbon domain-containing OB-fold protein [Nanoarchaeota archaeon]|nr:Zn-ribbon domain-containing OB-fold protein [Nanoarchaeota archaeon]